MKRILCTLFFFPAILMAEHLSIDMYAYTDNKSVPGTPIGQVTIEDSPFGGIIITPQLNLLPVGVHGFHIHEMPSCAPSESDGHVVVAGTAGGHFDPGQTNQHAGPYGAGHLGDLPILVVNQEGVASLPMLAPRVKTSDLHGHTLMIHMGSDNYSDNPAPNGGGGVRLGCGIIQ